MDGQDDIVGYVRAWCADEWARFYGARRLSTFTQVARLLVTCPENTLSGPDQDGRQAVEFSFPVSRLAHLPADTKKAFEMQALKLATLVKQDPAGEFVELAAERLAAIASGDEVAEGVAVAFREWATVESSLPEEVDLPSESELKAVQGQEDGRDEVVVRTVGHNAKHAHRRAARTPIVLAGT